MIFGKIDWLEKKQHSAKKPARLRTPAMCQVWTTLATYANSEQAADTMKILKNLLYITLSYSFALSASASLINNGNGTITDTETNLMWIQDANYAFTSGYDDNGKMTWSEAMLWVNELTFAGYNDWRLPTTTQPDSGCSSQNNGFSWGYYCSGSEMGNLYYTEGITHATPGDFVNLINDPYWSETEEVNRDTYAWGLTFGTGYQATGYKPGSSYVLAVRSVSAVPAPSGFVLFLTACCLLSVRRSRGQHLVV